MTAEQSNSILNSELAYDVLKLLAKKENGDYGKRIADELGKPQSSICRVLTSLTEENFVKRGKRTRAQFYEINYQGIAEFWYESLEKELDDESSEKDILEEKKEKVIEFGKKFFETVMNNCKEDSKTVSELLYNSFIYSVGEKLSEEDKFVHSHEFLRPITEGTIRRLQMYSYPKELEQVIVDIESS